MLIGSIDTKTDLKVPLTSRKKYDLPFKFLKITEAEGELKSINGYYLIIKLP